MEDAPGCILLLYHNLLCAVCVSNRPFSLRFVALCSSDSASKSLPCAAEFQHLCFHFSKELQ